MLTILKRLSKPTQSQTTKNNDIQGETYILPEINVDYKLNFELYLLDKAIHELNSELIEEIKVNYREINKYQFELIDKEISKILNKIYVN